MSLKVRHTENISKAKNKKSLVTLKQETRKFLETEIFPFLNDDVASEKFIDFLKEEANYIEKEWELRYHEEEIAYKKRMNA